MTRRSALLATTLMAGAYVGQAKAQGGSTLTPGTVSFDLTTFTSYTFTLGAASITFTSAELMAALQPCQHEAQPWAQAKTDVTFRVGGRALDVCRTCGVTYWRDGK